MPDRGCTPRRFVLSLPLLASLLFSGCETELMRRQAEQLRQQEDEITRQRKEIEALKLAQQRDTERKAACNRAFRDFDKAQTSQNRREAVTLYRQGLALCPDDDVAHYELGKILAELGESAQAEKEFEAALKVNPNFVAARKSLEELRRRN